MRVVQFLRWQKTAVIPQLQFITVVDICFVAQRQFFLVQTTQLTIEISLSFVFGGRCPCLQVHFSSWCCGRFHGPDCPSDLFLPQ